MDKSAWFQKIQFLPLYPFFFIASPVLALVGINFNEVEPNVLWRPLITLFSTLVLMLALRFIRVIGISSPNFVFAHLVIPHHPFVFGANGEELNSIEASVPPFEEYKVKYPVQVTYINKRMEAIIDIILSSSSRPPIIIIQGDHGPAHLTSSNGA